MCVASAVHVRCDSSVHLAATKWRCIRGAVVDALCDDVCALQQQ